MNIHSKPLRTLTVADFFCGAGGFSEGFYQSGFDVIFALDNWKPAVQTHDMNHPECNTCYMNILDLDTPENIDKIIPDTDIIIGSPPCVSFSNSNKSGKADKSLGIQLIEQFLKIILHKKTKPGSILKYWIMENVPNSLDYVKEVYTAKELGLDESLSDLHIVKKNILTASDYGSPQGRKRGIAGDYVIPIKTHNETNAVHIQNIMDALGGPLDKTDSIVTDPSYNEIKVNKTKLSDHLYDNELPDDWICKARRLKTDHGYMGKMDFPDRTNRLCRTIMATESYCSRESLIFKKENTNTYRAPTIRELACLMGFPITYQFSGKSSTIKHKQIGNAVCVHLSLALANAIQEDLGISLVKSSRTIKPCSYNLNNMKEGLFANHSVKSKKKNSKFHMHVPHLKLKQLRVELSNLQSNFETETYIWDCKLHKGAGKNAKVIQYNNSHVINLLKNINRTEFEKHELWFDTQIKPNLYDSNIYQMKYCEIPEYKDNIHLSPTTTLEFISQYIYLNIQDVYHDSIPELDTLLECKKPGLYSERILYSLYFVNKIVQCI
tara:strand:- start:18372 stop:20024 length:1653 start_codon:yes stop_codon:yes gene_type:complete